jgi:hypothetical protein
MTSCEVCSNSFPEETEENDENSVGIIFALSEIRTGDLTVIYNYNRPTDGY